MSAKIQTQFGEPVPPASRHSVTVHMGGWDNVERYGNNSSSVIAQFKNVYPRMRPHPYIVELTKALLEEIGQSDVGCYLFSSLQSAKECIEYATSEKRNNDVDRRPVAVEHIKIRTFSVKDMIFAVTFPLDQASVVAGFWSTPGVGVSSRFAEANLSHLHELKQITIPPNQDQDARPNFVSPVHKLLRERVIHYLERAPLNPSQQPHPSVTDVYFYQTGMAAIYKPHTYMLSRYQGTTVLFGMAFMNTLTAFEEFGPGYKFFGLGTDEDVSKLRTFLDEERSCGRKVQAIWAEFPANPLLVTPDITALRQLADEYDVVLAIDDTIGSWSNIDIIAYADLLVTSMTKSFNGYADAIAGCAVLNPTSPKYNQLKALFDEKYVPELYVDDAEAIERNSRDYLSRTDKMNKNANAIVQYLQKCADDPTSAVKQVHYPSVNQSGSNYERFMRRPTPEFTAGYGCLFSVELADIPTTQAFYDNLNVHKSVHLGAPVTLAFAYTMCTYKKRLDWAAQYGLKPTQIRISAGLEETDLLLQDFKVAVEASNKCWDRQ
ncbi:hypothetical protein M441DRAFT_79276 [Trichoderma asperellum CBS 433.97]|uniref:Cystathionine gamma-synthase n=1 Tax=Trichoderma asperellum (strain ATCC 204424 / CBS 433.97 / NBRC 101777) TaxID=1042311 RepID=A0A2T3ZCS8_TRIA4|nr:hypothetical protein M441DRAFT_79276 [Trichoderma asperellum CBS 433.97]PTB42611.1 hypothetical protein M441DRAFT_79276 [Trichoderma asperellum CBS 433.97]